MNKYEMIRRKNNVAVIMSVIAELKYVYIVKYVVDIYSYSVNIHRCIIIEI